MPPIRNPFSRDEHPDLTAAIMGVVNESHSRKTLEGLSTTRLRELRKKYQAGVAKGHADAARELAHIHGILRSRGAGAALDEDYQTPSREREMLRKIKRAERGSDAASKQYSRAWDAEYKTTKRNPKAEKASRVAGKKLAAASRKRDRLYATQRKEEMSRRLYGSRGKVLKRKVQEDVQTPSRAAQSRRALLRAFDTRAGRRRSTPVQRVALLNRIAKERGSETVYGVGGKPNPKAK